VSESKEVVERIFGTDGIRDRTGEGYLTEASVRRLARAIGRTLDVRSKFADDIGADRGRAVYIGRDTRASGVDLLEQVGSELERAGYDVGDLGVIPTPGVAHVAKSSPACCLAIVLSASHNPAHDNGIKVLTSNGTKISDAFEIAVSRAYHEDEESTAAAAPGNRLDLESDGFEMYVSALVEACERPERLAGKKIVLDAAHGAAYRVAPEVFRRLGATLELIGVDPDGLNINEGCGATCPGALAQRVRESGAALGFSFDGDADRMIPVSGAGTILDGDHVLALAARHYDRQGKLPNKAVVGTVMANVGLEKSLAEIGVRLRRTPVGDKYVVRAMIEEDHPIGGEQSGHLIFLDASSTGDGTLAALRLLDVLESDELDLEGESKVVTKFPQVLKNVRVRERVPLEEIASVASAVSSAEERLGADGRVLLRYSGTEPLARVMLEGPETALIEELCDSICAVIEAELGAQAG